MVKSLEIKPDWFVKGMPKKKEYTMGKHFPLLQEWKE